MSNTSSGLHRRYMSEKEEQNIPKGCLTLLLLIAGISGIIFLIVKGVIFYQTHPEYFYGTTE